MSLGRSSELSSRTEAPVLLSRLVSRILMRAAMSTARSGIRLTLLLLTVAVVSAVVALLALDDVRGVLGSASWPLVLSGVLVTVVAYAAIGRRFAALSHLSGIGSPWCVLTEVGYVSTTLGRVMFGGGTAGNILRITVLRRHGVPMGETLAASLLHTYLNFAFVLGVFFAGFSIVLIREVAVGGHAAGMAAAGALAMLLVALISIAVVVRPVRTAVVDFVVAFVQRVTGFDLSPHATSFHGAVQEAVSTARARRTSLLVPAALLMLEAVAAVGTLWFMFAAVGGSADPGIVVAGFGVGTAVGMASLVPGGLGAQEGAMAGVFVLLGIDFEQAVATSVLFRVVYFFLPFAVSLLFYRRLLRKQAAVVESPREGRTSLE